MSPARATSSSGGLLVRQVAGGHASVTVLGPPDRDLHYLQARPSMMRALRSADLLIAVGADLAPEIGYFLEGRAADDDLDLSLLEAPDPRDRLLHRLQMKEPPR